MYMCIYIDANELFILIKSCLPPGTYNQYLTGQKVSSKSVWCYSPYCLRKCSNFVSPPCSLPLLTFTLLGLAPRYSVTPSVINPTPSPFLVFWAALLYLCLSFVPWRTHLYEKGTLMNNGTHKVVIQVLKRDMQCCFMEKVTDEWNKLNR